LAEAIAALPEQGAAPVQFKVRDEKVHVLPPVPTADVDGMAQDYLEETRAKAAELLGRLARSNADPYVSAVIVKLQAVLAPPLAAIRPALVDSRVLSVAALVEAFRGPRGEQELFPDALARLIDLSLTARTFCDRLDGLRAVERAATALDLAPQVVPDVVAATRSITDAAIAAGILDPGAEQALLQVTEDAELDAPPAIKTKRAAYGLLTLRNLLLTVLRALGKEAIGFAKQCLGIARGTLAKATGIGLAAGVVALIERVFHPLAALAQLANGFVEIDTVVRILGALLKLGA
jgi:hypothetical protein